MQVVLLNNAYIGKEVLNMKKLIYSYDGPDDEGADNDGCVNDNYDEDSDADSPSTDKG